jgi:tetratricopeptide (TPR) repeat protein
VANNRTQYEEALMQGHSFSWDQQWEPAIQEFQRAINFSPEEPAPYAGLGMAYFELADLEQSLHNYKLAARYSRGEMIYLKHVADVQERLGFLHDAGQTYMAIGEIQLRRRRLDEAVGNWLRAIRLEPDLLSGHQRLAAVYKRQGLATNAIREYLAIARIYSTRGEKSKALKACQLALELNPRNPDVLTAIELVERGDNLITDIEPSAVDTQKEQGEVPVKVERAVSALESDLIEWQPSTEKEPAKDPIESAQKIALEELATEIFSSESNDNTSETAEGMSVLERDAFISQALDFQTRGMVSEAISCFESAIDGGFTNTAANFSLGILYQSQSHLDKSIGQFQKSAQSETYRLASHYATGTIYGSLGRTGPAVQNFVTVLKIIDLGAVRDNQTDRVVELYDYLEGDLLSSGDPDKAARFVKSLTSFLGQGEWEGNVQTARNRLNDLSLNDQVLILGDMLIAGSTQVLESLHLSQQYSGRGKYDTAVEEVYRAIQLSPDFLPGHLQLAQLMADQDRINIAVEKFVMIGDTYNVRGDIKAAVDTYERALEYAPTDIPTRRQLVELLLKSQQLERAVDHAIAMGETYYGLAQVDMARTAYVEALKITAQLPDGQQWRPNLLRRIADIDMQRLDWKEAIAAYSELIKLDPTDESAATTLIDLFFKIERPDLAVGWLDQFLIRLVREGKGVRVLPFLEQLVEQRPNELGLVDRLVRLLLKQERKAEALKLLDELGEAQQKPEDEDSYRQLLEKIRVDVN